MIAFIILMQVLSTILLCFNLHIDNIIDYKGFVLVSYMFKNENTVRRAVVLVRTVCIHMPKCMKCMPLKPYLCSCSCPQWH